MKTERLRVLTLCFDELDRIKSELLIELLGYINTLIEHEHIKVVFICNESELNEKEYHKYGSYCKLSILTYCA